MEKNPFGNWLKKWRKARRLTQLELGTEIGFTDSYISALERNATQKNKGLPIRPSEEFCEKAATALDRPVEEARALAGYLPSPVPPTRREIEDMFASSGGIVINPNSGNPQIATIDTETAREYARLIAEELAKVFPQPPTKANNDK